jgi:N-acetylglucosaminyldiphosphoundecaprenol N-acetyl-beta-D-mannosaminyltransferase
LNSRLQILDIWVDLLNKDECLGKVAGYLTGDKRPHAIFAVTPEKNILASKDPVLSETLKSADLLIPDGIGIVLAARILYGIRLERVPGVEFMEDICALAAKEGYRAFVYGGKDEVNSAAVKILKSRYSGLEIAARSHGYVREEEMPDLIKRINDSKADILFLALGSPKQEKWFATYNHFLKNVRVCQGIGGTLDTITGDVKRAPELWQKFWAEWLYRLLVEPRRIKRYKTVPIFIGMVLIAKLKSFFED